MGKTGVMLREAWEVQCHPKGDRRAEITVRRIVMDKKRHEEIRNAAKVLCEFCEANECEHCMVQKLEDDAFIEVNQEEL